MASYRLNNMAITIEKEGADRFTKASFPIRFGKYNEIRTSEYEFQFNLKGEIKFIRGLNISWPHPSESLKRTDGNDWVFYSVGTVGIGKGIIKWLGEYYLPCFPYPSNSIWEFNPYTDPKIMMAFAAWSQLYATLHEMQSNDLPSDVKNFLNLIFENDENTLHKKSEKLHSITGPISVLPPDSRHVDYEVIPLIIADGCLYHCNFCCVKSHHRFQVRSRGNILHQISQLKAFYNQNMGNYNALFMGNHDALGAGRELIWAASEAATAFGFENSNLKGPGLFLFGSVDSLLKAGNELFEELNNLPFHTYINVGFESVDAPTLASINKPLEISRIHDGFQKMLELNRDYANIEITANFLLGEQFSPDHNQSLAELLGSVPDPFRSKGTIYLSPFIVNAQKRPALINNQKRRNLLTPFFEIKKQSRLPVYIYLIQRL